MDRQETNDLVDKMKVGHTGVDGLLDEFKEVFTTELGTMSNVQVKLKVKEGIEPKFYRARPVPYILKPAIKGELIRSVEQGVHKPVANSAWVAPIVPVKKDNGEVRICGDNCQSCHII